MEFEVQDMTCGHCASRITKAVQNLDASAQIEVDIGRKRVNVTSAAAPDALRHAISEAGYTPTLKA
jgi:copper chaperone